MRRQRIVEVEMMMTCLYFILRAQKKFVSIILAIKRVFIDIIIIVIFGPSLRVEMEGRSREIDLKHRVRQWRYLDKRKLELGMNWQKSCVSDPRSLSYDGNFIKHINEYLDNC